MAEPDPLGALIVEALTRYHYAADDQADMETVLFGHMNRGELETCATGLAACVYLYLCDTAAQRGCTVPDLIRQLGLDYAGGVAGDG